MKRDGWRIQNNYKNCTKIKLSIKDFFSKCDQIRRLLQIWSHLLKNSLMENFIFCAVKVTGMPKKVKLRENKKIWKEKLSHSSYYQNYLDVLQNHSKIKIPGFTTKSSSLVRWKRQSHFTLKELWLRLAHLVC